MSLDFEREYNKKQLSRDTRSLPRRFTSWLKVPQNIAMLMTSIAILAFFMPILPMVSPLFLEPLVVLGLVLALWSFKAQSSAGLPLRFPKSSKVLDPNELSPGDNKKLPAEGIIYLGNDMDSGEELWLSDTMARTHMIFLGTTGSGKALSDDSPILTPAGWKLMGDLVVGDVLSLPHGLTTKVQGVFPQGRKRMYNIELANGRRVECCDEHLWLIREAGEERVARTDELLELMKAKEAFEIPCVDVITFAEGFGSSDTRWVLVDRISTGGYKNASCILVDSKEHLFVTGDRNGNQSAGVVTHNTEFLLSLVYNALIHGSGFIYVDGKADSSLYGKIYSMARQMGREDDVRVINFQTGAKDIFGPQPLKMSNTMNPFSVGSAGMLTNLVVSLMSSGKGDVWENRAISFVEALMKPLVFLRDNYGLMLDVAVIRDYFDIKKVETLTWLDADKYPGLNLAVAGMESYLMNLPTYDRNKYHKQGETALEQHGYITMQLVRTFNSLADTYGYIMKTSLAEIDFLDVFLNRRILVVLLPALEKSSAELQNLGKIIVASIKATMALGLGSRLEGSWAQVLDSKPTNSPSPYMCVLDEYGFYSVEGFSVVPAQARSIGFSAIFAGQDLPAFQKTSEKEADSILANTNTKFCGKLIDVKTARFFTDYSGKGDFTRASGFEANTGSLAGGFKETGSASIEKMDRITLDDLMRQKTGQWTIWFGSKIIRAKSFFASPAKIQTLRVNRMLGVARPNPDAVEFYRAANRGFIDAMAQSEGLSSRMDSIPIYNFMVVAEGLQKFEAAPGFHQALCALTHHTRDATLRVEAFDKLLDAFGGKAASGTRSFGVDSAAHEDPTSDEYDYVNSVSDQVTQTPVESKTNITTNLGLSALGDIDFSDDEVGSNTSELDLMVSQGHVTDTPSDDVDDAPEEAQPGSWNAMGSVDGEFDANTRSDLMSRTGLDVDNFVGATIFAATNELAGDGTENTQEPTLAGSRRPSKKAANPGQGQLDRDLTERGLQRIEMITGATFSEASLSASNSGSKLADITKYPITKPQNQVTPEDLTDIARRLSRNLDNYNEMEPLDE